MFVAWFTLAYAGDRFLWNWSAWLFVVVAFVVLPVVASPVVALVVFLLSRYRRIQAKPLLSGLLPVAVVLFLVASVLVFSNLPFR